ncbi:TonB-dependent hemoglobin/transferrin/lactoferrin family receptor [Vibrio agarivorans]|uniref:TonB-dependent hemoglobin/transferrin/lactoferrin family receptor n=1 Tax=Vibrio agarivorans TaxID=153622 RepID=A0ABT7XYD0_9VIBR|nr:TonB-dependent hemoglobin/transferrin/lactoferrin family receptor [Vibrio agarivorans]MDN2480790.1 TonB-dependent hemoglobin/transferrin/lactoferrin family receptor [Vibrio agarivorans]
MTHYKQTALSAAILLALSSGSALAQDNHTSTESTSAQADEVMVITATRSSSPIEDTAASVAIITADDIEANMVTDLGDLFKYTPGVTVESTSRQGVQGINIRGMSGNRVKITVDGVAQSNQFKNSYDFINSSRADVDPDMLKAVGVVKGAASSLHGSDAVGGIVAFETKDPSDFLRGKDFGGHAKFNYSSADNTFSESVALANRFGDLESLVAYTRRDGNEIDNFGSPDEQDTSVDNLLIKLQYQLNPSHRLEFSGNYLKNRADMTIKDESYTNYNGEDETEQYQVGIKHIWDAYSAIADTVVWQLDWLSKEENGVTNRTYLSDGNVQRKDYVYSDEGVQFDLQIDKHFMVGNTQHYVIYGAAFSDKDIENTNLEYNTTRPDSEIFYMPNASERRYGLFAQDEISFGNWIVTPGIRYDSFETDPGDASDNPSENPQDVYTKYSDSAFTARLGTVYKINNEHRLFAQVSQGFRAPDFQELFYSYGNPMFGYVSAPNPDLKAEESISYELGWRHNHAISSTEIAIFYSDYDNFIDSECVTGSWTPSDPCVNMHVNKDKAEIRGVELGNNLSWDEFVSVRGFSSRIAAAYTEGEDGDGNPLNSINPWNLVASLNYDSESNWGTSLNVNYTASKDASDINGDYLPISSATIVDVTAYYKPIQDLTLRAGIFNLTDEEYYSWNDVRDLVAEDKDKTQAGRNWSITAKYEF